MLATLIPEPFDDPEWLFEIKWDGYRAICTIKEDGSLTLVSRNGLDMLQRFPDLHELDGAFASIPVIVDGEIVSLDKHGRSEFQRLQEFKNKPTGLTYVAFDLLYADGTDLRSRPLEERKALLERLIRDETLVLYSKHVDGRGKDLFARARDQRLEGIIGKKRSSTYQERRSRDWVKIKTGYEQEFVVGGWTEPKGSRKGFGALLLRRIRKEGVAIRRFGRDGVHDEAPGRALRAPAEDRTQDFAVRQRGRRKRSGALGVTAAGRASALLGVDPRRLSASAGLPRSARRTSRRTRSSPSNRCATDGRGTGQRAGRIAYALAFESR